MTDLNTLLDEAAQLIGQDSPSLSEMKVRMVEMDELIHSPEFQTFSYDDRSRLQAAYKELRKCIRELENPGSQNGPGSAPGFQTSLPEANPAGRGEAGRVVEAQSHNPYAEQMVEEAERLFYGGRYADAIKLYDQALKIEPGWERARQHRGESENYLRTGYIPSVALPAEAASAFGKAQSAARLGRYVDAMALLEKAQATLREMGIQRWQEGQEFEQKLQQYIDAESVYGEGLQLFNQGNIDEGIDKVETAAQATGLPKYNDKAQELRRAKASMQAVAETLNTALTDPKAVAQIKTDLDSLILQHGDNPAFHKLKTALEAAIPKVTEPLKDQVRELKSQADRAQTLDAVLAKAKQAKLILDQARNLGYVDETLEALQGEVDRLFRDVQRYEDELQQATTVFNTNRSWPAAAARMSQGVRARYPNDPRVIEFNRSLAPYRNALLGIKAGGIIIGLIIIGLLISFGVGRYNAYNLSLTPTATATPTRTPTSTPLPSTATNTPRPTLTPSLTPTPLTGVVAREVWVRDGCYETFHAIGRIPTGSQVRFMPDERTFDTFNRECLLVKYIAPDQSSLIGWILIADLEQ